MTYDKTEKTAEITTKIGITACKKIEDFFVEFSNAIMNVDSYACLDVIILKKKHAMQLPSQRKFKNRTRKLDFLQIQCYANSVVITHFFKIKQDQNALCLFVSDKLGFPRARKHFL